MYEISKKLPFHRPYSNFCADFYTLCHELLNVRTSKYFRNKESSLTEIVSIWAVLVVWSVLVSIKHQIFVPDCF